MIQIILRFGKNSIPYRPLNLSKGHFCYKQTVNFEENKLPKIFSTNLNLNKKNPITKYEDNNILVPWNDSKNKFQIHSQKTKSKISRAHTIFNANIRSFYEK